MTDRWRSSESARDTAPHVPIHGADAFAAMRRAGRLAAEVLDFVTPHVVPGATTGALDALCHDFIVERGAVPAPLNYRGFPKSVCTSVNHVVCHGIPGDKVLADGDIVNIDITVILDGWHGDTSRMFPVGRAGVKARRLMDVTYESLMRGIEAVRPGRRWAISATPSRAMSRPRGSRWCAISAATGWGGSSTARRACCITAAPARG